MKYIPLTTELIKKAQYISSFKAKEHYKKAGIRLVDTKTWSAFQKTTTNDFINKNLARTIEELYENIQK
jgi:hypothetical protein